MKVSEANAEQDKPVFHPRKPDPYHPAGGAGVRFEDLPTGPILADLEGYTTVSKEAESESSDADPQANPFARRLLQKERQNEAPTQDFKSSTVCGSYKVPASDPQFARENAEAAEPKLRRALEGDTKKAAPSSESRPEGASRV